MDSDGGAVYDGGLWTFTCASCGSTLRVPSPSVGLYAAMNALDLNDWEYEDNPDGSLRCWCPECKDGRPEDPPAPLGSDQQSFGTDGGTVGPENREWLNLPPAEGDMEDMAEVSAADRILPGLTAAVASSGRLARQLRAVGDNSPDLPPGPRKRLQRAIDKAADLEQYCIAYFSETIKKIIRKE